MREPDMKGSTAVAWRVSTDSAVPDHQATLGAWLVQGPFHPFWSYWLVVLIHLRPIAGVRPAFRHYPQAEFEFAILSCSPEEPPPDPDKAAAGYALLEPADVIEQFHGVSDRDALRILEDAVRRIVDGKLSPDQDYRSTWHDVIQQAVERVRAGLCIS